MKSTVKILMSFVFASVLFFYSCSSDDDAPPAPSASDITTTIDENPASGSVIGTITTNLSGTLSFSISSQSVANALTINGTTGEVTVSNGLAFDFESNPTITAAVSVTNSTETAAGNVTVTLNNIDDIAHFLSASQAIYNATAVGDWAEITVGEYTVLATSLNDVVKAGTTDAEYDAVFGTGAGANASTWANDNTASMPSGSYVFAFKYTAPTAGATDTKVKQSSTSVSTGYANLGNGLPMHDAGERYFVLKGNDTPTTDVGFIAMYAASGITGKFDPSKLYFFQNGDLTDFTVGSTTGATILFQGLTTTQKQWD